MKTDERSMRSRIRQWRGTTVLSADGSRRAIVRVVSRVAVTPAARRMCDLLGQDLRRAVEPDVATETVRTQYQMRRALADVIEVTAEVRLFRGGADSSPLKDVCRDAFAWNPFAVAEMERLISDDGEFRSKAGRIFVHEEDGMIDGFCWVKERGDEKNLGEVYALGVATSASGRGLGRQLLRVALADLHEHGMTTAVLNVDASNINAVALYVSEGFIVHRLEREFDATPPTIQTGRA